MKGAITKISTAIALLASGYSSALGLGDITTRSNLNEPYDATVELLQAQGLEATEVLVSLASRSDFERANVERTVFLSGLDFKVVNEGGDLHIEISSFDPVQEPFLNFLVEVNWAEGKILKEYTVLLDPPAFDQIKSEVAQTSDPIDLTSLSSEDSTASSTTQQAQSGSQSATSTTTATRSTDPAGTYRVQNNDTLWEIAIKTRPSSRVSPQQVMLALQDLNPDAFLNGNINSVKAGSLLQIPSSADVNARSFAEAEAEVSFQNRMFKEGKSVQRSAIISADSSSALENQQGGADPDGSLKVVSSGDSAGGSDSETRVEAVENELAIAQEEAEKVKRERDEMSDRLQLLEEQLAAMQRLLEIQSNTAVQVQQAVTEAEATETEVIAESTQVLDELEASTVDSTTTESAMAESTESPQPTETTVLEAEAPAEQVVETPKPVISKPVYVEPEPTLVDKIFAAVMNQTYQMIVGGVALLALIGLWLRNRRKADEDEFEDDELSSPIEDFDEDDLEEELVEGDDAEEEVAHDDDLQNAEFYLAYSQFEQAEGVLRKIYDSNPGRSDVREKLLEVYAELGNADAFAEIESSFDASQLSQMTEYSTWKARLSESAVAVSSAEIEQPSLPEDSLNLDDSAEEIDLSMDIGGDDLDAEMEELDVSLDIDSDELSLDFELPQDDVAPDALADQGGDLEIDIDLGGDEELPSMDLDFGEFGAETESSGDDLDDLMLDLEADVSGMGGDDSLLEAEDSLLDIDLDAGEDLGGSLEGLNLDASTVADDLSADLELDAGLELGADLELDNDLGFETTAEEDQELSLDGLGAGLDELNAFDAPEQLSEESPVESAIEAVPAVDEPSLPVEDDLEMESSPLADMATDDSINAEDEFPPLGDLDSLDAELDQLADNLGDADSIEAPSDETSDNADWEDDFDFLAGADEVSTKLDLARAYIEMEDFDGAKDILNEVIEEGDDNQKAEADELMKKL